MADNIVRLVTGASDDRDIPLWLRPKHPSDAGHDMSGRGGYPATDCEWCPSSLTHQEQDISQVCMYLSIPNRAQDCIETSDGTA